MLRTSGIDFVWRGLIALAVLGSSALGCSLFAWADDQPASTKVPAAKETAAASGIMWVPANVATGVAPADPSVTVFVDPQNANAIKPGEKATLDRWIVNSALGGMGGGMAPKMVKAAHLGTGLSVATPTLRSQLSLPNGVGLVVDFVEPESPASKADVKVHDVIEKLDEQILVSAEQFAILVRMKKPGDDITLSLYRQAKRISVQAKLVEKEIPELGLESAAGSPETTMPRWGILTAPVPTVAEVKGIENPINQLLLNAVNPQQAIELGLMAVTFNDADNSIEVTGKAGGNAHVKVVDGKGNTVFNRTLASKADWDAVPEPIRKKLHSIEWINKTQGSAASEKK